MEYIFPTDQHLEAGFHEVAEAIKDLNTTGSVYPVWDADKGEFDIESIKRWFNVNCDGKQYGVDQTIDIVQTVTKVLANADIPAPTPSTLATPGTDPYLGVGPFRYEHINMTVDDDGTKHVTGMESFGNFSYTDGRDVYAAAPVRYVSHGVVNGKYRTINSDRPHVGLMPEEKSMRPDGTLEPFMARAVFAASKDSDGKPRSVAGARLWNRTCSHNSMRAAVKKKGNAYSGYTVADYDYLYEMYVLKYGTKDSQKNFTGCVGHSEQTPVTVAGTDVATVTVAKSVAQNWPIGSAVMVGTTTVANRDRNQSDAYDIADQANIVKKTVAGDNIVLTLDVGSITTQVGQIVSTAPWNPGATVGIVGDGSPFDNKSNREPFMLQGIEVMVGAYENLGDQLVKGTDEGFAYYQVADTTKASDGVTSDYERIYTLPKKDSDGESYPTALVKGKGALVPYDFGGSTGQGVGDGIYYFKDTNGNTYQVLVFGSLRSRSVAGLRRASLSVWPGRGVWDIAGRVSVDGQNGVNRAELPQAA